MIFYIQKCFKGFFVLSLALWCGPASVVAIFSVCFGGIWGVANYSRRVPGKAAGASRFRGLDEVRE